MRNLTYAFNVVTKPIGPLCNLDCKYCFYLEKERLFPSNEPFKMPDAVLEKYIEQFINGQSVQEVSFVWQGGEPTLLGVDFFRKVVALQRKYANGKTIYNALQTNGTLLNSEWGDFLAEHRFLLGISIDGPECLHNSYRRHKNGRNTFDEVMRGITVLRRHGIEFNTLTVVNNLNVEYPLEIYRFLKEIGSTFLQFIPLIERSAGTLEKKMSLQLALPPDTGDQNENRVTEWSVTAEKYGIFLCAIFDAWSRSDVGRIFVQLFEATLANHLGLPSGLCVFSKNCGKAPAMEHNGDIYSCDHYVYPQYKLGNIFGESLNGIVTSPKQQKFGLNKEYGLPRYCRNCDVRFACHGECPKHRFLTTPDGELGLNYLCVGYQQFFKHSNRFMQNMAANLSSNSARFEHNYKQTNLPRRANC